ncbi:asparaginase [Microbacterium limosum]|uniref:Asparaginase n=1 Tax=Microbacterium limosum TaxID=3079935 RepID=A0AAU0MFD0_9MICO|nr:asparaginase [Microbacterium sp. Y20]WOQ68689.1 asparaginase [Microbacterium sp. Y20]
MLQTFSSTDAVELATLERGGFIESRHSGSAVVLAPDGSVRASHGSPDAAVLPRSSLKPLQAVGILTAGAPLQGEQLGLSTASHSGTDRHIEVVRDILGAAGLTEDALACPATLAGDPATRERMVRDLEAKAAVRHNCSGKHAGMLAACVASGWATDGYLDVDHPLQVHLRDVVERLTGEKVRASVTDGCGAPVHAMSLTALARGVQRVGTAAERSPFALHRHAAAVREAVRSHPWTIAGPGWPDTVVGERLGLFSKLGAEGVQVMVASDGTTVALKVLDGSQRAATAVALRLLRIAGALAEDAEADALAHLDLAVYGGGAVVGAIRPSPSLG